ncbi:MAG: phosphoribosylglycinamide formyltransferase [Deltaproteobacteria bacterium]|nr:phosphoribosylglycinamide formyltransferase [Deltaproteobacteria bacterium]
MSKTPVAVFVSGRGSNMKSLIDWSRKYNNCGWEVVCVISDNKDAPALKIASDMEVTIYFVDPSNKSKAEYESEIDEILNSHDVGIIALAGFMRIIGEYLLKRWSGRILNIHPSLLPAFPGLNVQKRALNAGVGFSGCSVHLVDEGIDSGKILGQATVEVQRGETVESLTNRILEKEHKLYPEVITEYINVINHRSSVEEFIIRMHERFDIIHGTKTGENLLNDISGNKPALGVSACLCGINCRYDGKNQFMKDLLRIDEEYEIVPLCPEFAGNLGVPRPPMEFTLLDVSRGENQVDLQIETGESKLSELICGSEKMKTVFNELSCHCFIGKERSPSCGSNFVHMDGKLVLNKGIFTSILAQDHIPVISDEVFRINSKGVLKRVLLNLKNKKC